MKRKKISIQWGAETVEWAYKGIVAISLYAIWKMFWPMIALIAPHMFVAAILASALYRPHQRFVKFLGNREKTAVAIMVIFFGMFSVGSIIGVSVYTAKQVSTGVSYLKNDNLDIEKVQEAVVSGLTDFKQRNHWSAIAVDQAIKVASSDVGSVAALLQGGGIVSKAGKSIIKFAGNLLGKLVFVIGYLAIVAVFVVIFLIKGKKCMNIIIPYISFLGEETTKKMVATIRDATNDLINSMIATGLGQGGLAIFMMWVYCYNYMPINTVLLLLLTVVTMSISACGISAATLLMIVFVCISFFQGHYIAMGLLVAGTGLVMISDNIIKNAVLMFAGTAKDIAHPLILTSFVLIGAYVHGPKGVLLGPVVVIAVVVIKNAFFEKFMLTNSKERP